MHACHIWWTKPKIEKYQIKNFFIEDYELLLMILSALTWKKYQQKPIHLYCDSTFKKYLAEIGLLDLKIWDVIDTSIINSIPTSIDSTVFFNAPLFYVIKEQNTSFAVLDHDFYLKEQIKFNRKYDLLATHREKTLLYQYPPFYNTAENCKLKQFNWQQDAINACFLWFQNLELVQQYSEYALEYIQKPAHNVNDTTKYLKMLFIEQRLLGEICQNFNVKFLIKDIYIDEYGDFNYWEADENGEKNHDNIFHHLFVHEWSDKKKMYNHYKLYIYQIEKYLDIIKKDFTYLHQPIQQCLVLAKKKINYIDTIYQKYL